MNAATSRADATGISQADLGLASFDSGDFTVTNGWVELSSSGIDFADLPQLDQYEAYGRTDSGTGDVSAVTFSDIAAQGGSIVDADFTTELDAASDPGEALIKASAGVYKVTNVTKTGETNSIIKTDTSGVTDLQGLKIDGNLALDSSASTLNITTPGGIDFATGIGSTQGNTVTSLPGRRLDIGGADASASNTQGATDGALAVDHMYVKFIESAGKGANPTGIAIGQSSAYVSDTDDSAEGRVAIVADGSVPVLVTTQGIVPGDANMTFNIGDSQRKYNTVYANVFDGTATKAQYADLAENYIADENYDMGTVVIFGGDKEVTTTQLSEDTRVAGVVSDKPAYLMNSAQEGGTPIALQGRVKVKIAGMCRKGDMLVTSSIRGHASSSPDPRVGTVLGKALEDHMDPNNGLIEMVVGRV